MVSLSSTWDALMVFTHVPCSLLLIAIPLLPDAWLAVLFWLVRAFFVQMDAPAGQSTPWPWWAQLFFILCERIRQGVTD
jgi:hypothetical protein